MGWGIFGRLPTRNKGFATLLGGLHVLLMLAMAGIAAQRTDETGLRLFSIPLMVMVAITLLGAAFFAKPPSESGQTQRPALGAGHLARAAAHRPGGAGHVGVVAVPVPRLAVAAQLRRRGAPLRADRRRWWPAS